MADFVDHYAVLELESSATGDDIRTAVRNQRRIWNMRQASSDQRRRSEAEARCGQIDRAEKVLLDVGARRRFDTELTNRPAVVPVSVRGTADTNWVERTIQYLAVGDGRSANYAAREATQINPTDAPAWALRSESSFLLNHYSDAEFELKEAISIAPDQASYIADLGEIYGALGLWTPALAQYTQARRMEPDNLVFQAYEGVAMINLDRSKEAKKVFRTLVKKAPSNPVFKYYLVIALHHAVVESFTRLRDGRRQITSLGQAQLAQSYALEASRLNVPDKDAQDLVTELHRWADEALTVRWLDNGSLKIYVAAFVVLGICPMFSGKPAAVLLALIMGTSLVVAYVVRHRKPGWEHNEKLARGQVAEAGIRHE